MGAVVAIDTGMRGTGWAVFVDGRLVETGSIPCRRAQQTDVAERVGAILEAMDHLSAAWRPEEVAYTNPVRNQWPVPALDELHVALKTWAERQGLPLFQYTPREIRASIVGRANAPKEDLAYTVMSRWGLIGMSKTTMEWDAIAAGDYHLQCQGERMVPQVS